MKNLQMLEERRWKPLCSVKEINGLKKRKPKEALQSFRVELKAGEAAEGKTVPRGHGLSAIAALPPQQQPLTRAHFPEQSPPPPSRLVLCPQRPADEASPQQQRASYQSSPEPSASPRKRPGDGGGGVSAEIKAIQQTRRLLANARERTRVHTISAAFEALRKQVPCYSYGQKLSKLAILRIACNYILSLATLADLDYSADHNKMSFSECVEQCTRTLQAEGRSKKRKE
ncbi:transcription factor ATOH8 [Microcaecilia unicolor]|uniref:Protein atonal homolog 8 n=1 Tax=Microcaecilia unicolor TaxID=1415580 RepID=A0A6P7X395_9AMPH|nr:protein atonal homolog 8 [Microcaecilia unicolor]